MPPLTNEERKKRRKKLQKQALESVAARGQFNFRLEGKDIRRLYGLAGRRQEPVSAMVRQWVLERLEAEETSKYPTPAWAQAFEKRLSHAEAYVLMALSSREAPGDPHWDEFRCKLRDHIKRHWDIEKDEELRALWTQ